MTPFVVPIAIMIVACGSPRRLESSCLVDQQNGGQFFTDQFRQTSMSPPWLETPTLTDCETARARLIAMEQPSKRAQFVHGMRACSAHNRLLVNAPPLRRFAQSYIIGSSRFGGSPWRRTAKIFARTDRAPHESRQDSFRWGGLRYSPANAVAFSQRDARAVAGPWPNIENENRRGSRPTVRAQHARI